MKSKFIILVVLVTLVQSSLALQFELNGLLEKATATLTKLSYDEEVTIEGKFDGCNPVFDTLDRLAAIHIWNLTAETDDSATQIAQALAKVKDATDYSWDATLSVVGKDCAADEEIRTSTHSDLDHVYSLVPIAIDLAKAGNFSGNQTTIEDLHLSVQKDLANLVGSIYGSIASCLNTKDKGVLARIKLSEDGLRQSLIHSNNAVFNAIKTHAAAVHSGSKDLALITAIEDARSYASAALNDGAEHIFSLVKALRMNSELGLSDAASDFNSIQYAETSSRYKWIAAVTGVYETLTASLSNVALGLSYAGDNGFSPTDAAQAKTAADFMAGFQALVDSVLDVNPNATTVAAAALKSYAIAADEVSASYYGGIVATQSQDATYAEALETIETLRTKTIASIKFGVAAIFDLIKNDYTPEHKGAAEIKANQDDATNALISLTNGIHDMTIILLNATYGCINVSPDDFAAIQTSQTKLTPLMAAFTYNIAAARLTTLITDLPGLGGVASYSSYATSSLKKNSPLDKYSI